LGGVKHWCIHCELSKENNKIKETGYLVKIRYDMLCSVEEKLQHGGDIKKIIKLLIQYIHDVYPEVKYVLFNDLSTRRCNNGPIVNLAVMTYLYSEKTWYEKNFDASIAPQSATTLAKIITKLNESKRNTPWSTVKEMIYNYKELPFTEDELESLYKATATWRDFFEPIVKKIDIPQFCIFISPWIDSFIIKYFNNLMGLTYQIPIKETGLTYTKNEYMGGRYKSYFKGARKNKTIKRQVEIE